MQSELVIERVLLDRGQTRLKEFLNDSIDPTVVCSVSELTALNDSATDGAISNILRKLSQLVLFNEAALEILDLKQAETERDLEKIEIANLPIFRVKKKISDIGVRAETQNLSLDK